MNNRDQVNVLNDLITKNYDAEKGYKEAITNINNEQFKNIFQDCANRRYEFGHQLKSEIKNLGGEIEKGDSLAAKAHRTWMDLKTAMASNEEKAVLNEIVRGESYAVDAYDEALQKLPIDSPAYDVIVNQRNAIRSAKVRMEGLEVITEATTS